MNKRLMYFNLLNFNEQTVAEFPNNGLLTYNEEEDWGITNGLFLKIDLKN